MTRYQVPDQTESIARLKGGYGGSSSSTPSFLRPEFVKNNSFAKARDLGTVANLAATLKGVVGTERGSNTLYFKVTSTNTSDIRVFRNKVSKYTDQYISVGLLGEDKKPIQRTTDGFGYINEIINTDVRESRLTLPTGTYYFTVSNSQWQALPYSLTLQVIRYRSLEGSIDGALIGTSRIALVKLPGTALLSNQTSGTVPVPSKVKALAGFSESQSVPYITLTIMKGTAGGTMDPYGRLKATWRISGPATGTNQSSGTLSSAPPSGGGYP